MDELFTRLGSLGGEPGVWESLLGTRSRLLERAGRAFVDASPVAVEHLRRAAEEAWSRLSEPRSHDDLDWCCAVAANRAFARADATRLHRNALNHFAAAMAVGLIRHPAESPDLDALTTWLGRVAGPYHSPQLREPLGGLSWTDLAARVGGVLVVLPPPAATRFRLYLRYFLAADLPTGFVVPSHRVRASFPTHNDVHGGGGVFELELTELTEGEPGLYEAPECFHVPLADHWLGVIRRAYGRHSFTRPVVWCIRRLTEPRGTSLTVSGESHTAAACVGFRALLERQEVDPGCVISAWFGKDNDAVWGAGNPELKPIEGIRRKCEAACEYTGRTFTRMLFRSPDLPHDQQTFTHHGRTLSLGRPKTLEDAYQDATGLLADLRGYYRAAVEFFDRDLPVYLGARPFSELYIEPDVLRDVIRPDPEPTDRGPDQPDGRRQVKLEAASESEERSRDKEATRRERVAWRRVWPTARRAVIIGDPGEGKSILARHLLRELAQQGLAELNDGQVPVARSTAPVFLRLSELAEFEHLDEAIRAAVTRLTVGRTPCSDALVRHLLAAARGESGTLILDGLDEVPGTRILTVRRHLEALAGLPCRAVLTSRPYGYQRGGLPFAELNQFELAPLSPDQRRAFVQRWFFTSLRRDWQGRVQELVAGAGLGAMSQNAFLLTLTCAEAEIRDLSANARRPHLYFWIVRDLIRGAWRQAPPPLDENDTDLDIHVRRLRRVCWALFEPTQARAAFTRDEWFDALERSGCNLERAGALLGDWQARGVLVPLLVRHRDVEQPGWAFAHRSLLEYLAAGHVAQLPNPVAAVERYLWVEQPDGSVAWTPDAQDFLQLLAGCLPDPETLLRRLLELDRDKPDALYVMVRLAGHCLTDVDHTQISPATVAGILSGAEAAYLALGQTRALALAFRHAAGVQWLERRLSSASGAELAVLISLTGHLGPIAARPAILDILARTIRGEAPALREFTALALVALGPAAASHGVVAALLGVLRGTHRTAAAQVPAEVFRSRSLALEVMGRWGSAAESIPGVVDVLTDALWDRDTLISAAAATALGRWGPEPSLRVRDALLGAMARDDLFLQLDVEEALVESGAATNPDVRATLRDVFRGGERAARKKAAYVLGRTLNGDVATGELFGGFVAALRDGNLEVRREAAGVLAYLEQPAIIPGILDILLGALDDVDAKVRSVAAQLLGRIGTSAAIPGVLDALSAAATDLDQYVRVEGADALASLGSVATSRAVSVLAVALGDNDALVRASAARALARCSLGLTSPVIDVLLGSALRDRELYVRRAAAAALGALGAWACPRVLDTLVSALRDGTAPDPGPAVGATDEEDWLEEWVGISRDVRCTAAETLGALGPAVAGIPVVLDTLAEALRSGATNVPLAAARAIGALGPAAATAGVVGALVNTLRRPNTEVGRSVVRTLALLGPEVTTVGVIDALLGILQDWSCDVDWLAREATARWNPPSFGYICDISWEEGHRLLCSRVWLAASKAMERMLSLRTFRPRSLQPELPGRQAVGRSLLNPTPD